MSKYYVLIARNLLGCKDLNISIVKTNNELPLKEVCGSAVCFRFLQYSEFAKMLLYFIEDNYYIDSKELIHFYQEEVKP